MNITGTDEKAILGAPTPLSITGVEVTVGLGSNSRLEKSCKKEFAPDAFNMGAIRDYNSGGCTASIDWFTISFANADGNAGDYADLGTIGIDHLPTRMDLGGKLPRIISILDEFGFPVDSLKGLSGRLGFTEGVVDVHERVNVLSNNGATGKGLCVVLTGKGCSHLGLERSIALCRALYALMGGVVTRLDLAVDFFGGVAQKVIKQSRRSYRRGHLRRLRGFENGDKWKAPGEYKQHASFYGSRSSEVYLRIYDKGLESGKCDLGLWVRWEVEFKGRKCSELSRLLFHPDEYPQIENLGVFISSYSLSAAQFLRPDKNHTSRPVRWYGDLIRAAGASSVTLPSDDPPRHWAKRDSWFSGAGIVGFMNAVAHACGVDGSDFYREKYDHIPPVCVDPDDPVFMAAVAEFASMIGGAHV